MTENFKEICGNFMIPGDFISAEPYGTGHINDTWRVTFNQGGTVVRYTLQRLNTNVFRAPEKVMENIGNVLKHVKNKPGQTPLRSRENLTLIPALDGKNYLAAPNGFFRMYVFIEQAQTYDVIETDKQAFEAASAFGGFTAKLADFPGRLHETIPDFHNTPARLRQLEEAAEKDSCGRKASVAAELDFFLSRREEYGLLLDLQKSGEIPERITHNDTKLNNVLIDDATGSGLCVIDLDTVMPGLVHFDFGDMVRTGTSPVAEDEPDASKVFMQFNRFEALLRGYLHGAGAALNATEKELLPFAGKLITCEIGMRFLADYLNGDVYFKIHRPEHNLERCRTQIALASSIEKQLDRMRALLKNI